MKMNDTRRRRPAHGFTLLEMMLVVVIIGMLATVSVIALAGQGDKARRQTTKSKLAQVKLVVDNYYLEKGRYPDGFTVLTTGGASAPLPKIPKDGWNNELVYYTPGARPEEPYALFSVGKDGLPQTEDDISVWDMDDEEE